MFRKSKKVNSIKPNESLFKNRPVGRNNFKPLLHKDGRSFTDIEYFELLGRKAIEMEENNPNPRIPVNYGEGIDRDTVAVAKEVVKAIDNGMSNKDIQSYLNVCIDLEQ